MNTTPQHHYVGLTGIVDKVRAIRSNDEVRYLEATVHVSMSEEYVGTYGGKVTVDLSIPLPITTEINPGDVCQVSLDFVAPFGHRFQPALEVGEDHGVEVLDDDDDGEPVGVADVLEVMVEDGMIEESS